MLQVYALYYVGNAEISLLPRSGSELSSLFWLGLKISVKLLFKFHRHINETSSWDLLMLILKGQTFIYLLLGRFFHISSLLLVVSFL